MIPRMAGYTKLFNSILASSVWSEDDKTRIVWITLLAMADKHGVADTAIPGLADLSRVSLEDCEKAVEKLKSPDKYSRTKLHEGRRIEECEGGFRLLNHGIYRAKMSMDERREYNRVKQQEHRQKLSKTCQIPSMTVNHNEQSKHIAEAESREQSTKAKKKSTPLPPLQGDIDKYFLELGMSKLESERFHDHYASNGWKVGKNPMKDWQASARNWKKTYIAKNTSHSPRPYEEQGRRNFAPLYPKAPDYGPDLTPEQIAKNKEFASEMVRKVKHGH